MYIFSPSITVMGLFDRLFGVLSTNQDEPKIRFGRFTDAHKSQEQYDDWDAGIKAYSDGDYLRSFEKLLDFLDQDDQDNIERELLSDQIKFHIHQGSKCVHGTYGPTSIYAESKIVKIKEYSIGYLRRMVEHNYNLNYARYAIDSDNNIAIVFDGDVRDSPLEKLYFAFKEMAINADKQDDLLLDEFKSLEPIDESIKKSLSEEIKDIKYQFIIDKAKETFEQIDQIRVSPDKQQGAISYMLLALIYKLDFLTVPEGNAMEAFERMHRIFFKDTQRGIGQKNAAIIKELHKLTDRPKESFLSEFYDVCSTFGITYSIEGSKMVEFIDPEIKYIQWYIQNNHPIVAEAVCSYIVGYLLFNHTPPKPAFQLFILYYRVIEASYFKALGFSELYIPESDTFDQDKIQQIVKDIYNTNKDEYPKLKLNGTLSYNTKVEFARSFILLLRQADFSKKPNRDV